MHKSSKVQKNAESWVGHDVWSMLWLSIQSPLFTRHCSAETHGKTHFFFSWLSVRWFQSGYQRKAYRRKGAIYVCSLFSSCQSFSYNGSLSWKKLFHFPGLLFLFSVPSLSLFVVSEMTLLCPLRDTRAKMFTSFSQILVLLSSSKILSYLLSVVGYHLETSSLKAYS